MLNLFISFVSSKKPIVLIPGMYGSNLYANFTDANLPWLCPRSGQNQLVWGNILRIIKPIDRCTFSLLQEHWNNSDVARYPNITIKPNKFGPLDDIMYKYKIPGLPFGIPGDFSGVIKAFIKKGYKPGVDLLAAPYDFRRVPMFMDDYYTNLKNLIEKARGDNKKKVTLIAFDAGALVMQRFLYKNVTWGWKNTNIRNTVMVAPDLAGSIRPFLEGLYNETERIPYLKNKWVAGAFRSWPITFAQLPNLNVFPGETLIRFPLVNISTHQIANHMVKFGLVRGDDISGLNRTLRILRKELNDYELPTTVIYNSGINTLRRLEFREALRKYPNVEFTGGDGMMLSDGAKFICSRWSSIRCIDVNNDGWFWRHQRFLNNPYVVELVVNASIQPDWAVKGRIQETSPDIYTIPFFGYYVNDKSRKGMIKTDL